MRTVEPGGPTVGVRGAHATRSTPTSCGSSGLRRRAAEAAYWEAWYAADVRPADGVLPRRRPRPGDGRRDGSRGSTRSSTPTPRAKRLIDELLLHPDFPHHRPQNGARRQIAEPHDVLRSRGSAVGYHRIQWSSNRADVAGRLGRPGVAVRAGKAGSVRFETCRKDYREALALARRLAAAGRPRHPAPHGRSAARSTTSCRSRTCGWA